MLSTFASPEFVATAVVAILALAVFRGSARQIVFLTINLVVIWTLFLGPVGTMSTLAFCLLGYALTRVVEDRSHWGVTVGLAAYIVLFVYMRRYDFLELILPDSMLTTVLRTAGLSFLFFKVVHVMIEAKGGTLGKLDFPTYLNYCLNFTTFLMGPIQRYQDYADQWHGRKDAIPPTFEAHLDALLRIAFGVAKAYVLASWFETRALSPDTPLTGLTMTGIVIQVYAFWFYLYLNFSGYCDVAIGVGSLLGVRPPENFNKPFLASNISDFWLRQHRSLTLWLTDFVFTPAYKGLLTSGGWWARHPLFGANMCLVLTMLVSGLWHGTTVSFLLFGIAHGLLFVIYRSWDALMVRWLGRKRLKRLNATLPARAAGIFLTFNATAFAFIFFRLQPEALIRTLSEAGIW